ncbi:MAG: hypothetical protein N3E44_06640 [Candidatus Bathyarchaeota archaeon]|nr:hypothetical protein [Candidatus Bathyarchaeota archaeon]
MLRWLSVILLEENRGCVRELPLQPFSRYSMIRCLWDSSIDTPPLHAAIKATLTPIINAIIEMGILNLPSRKWRGPLPYLDLSERFF